MSFNIKQHIDTRVIFRCFLASRYMLTQTACGESLMHDESRQYERKRVAKDLTQWMFLILRTGVTVALHLATARSESALQLPVVTVSNRLAEEIEVGPHQWRHFQR